MDSQRQSALQTSINNNSMRQTTQTSHQMAVNKYHTMMQPKTLDRDKAVNAAAQTGRIPGGMAQGTLKTFAAGPVAMESAPQGVKETLHIGGAQRPMVMPDGKRLHGSPASTGKPITEAAQHLNQGIQNRTDAWVPPPQSEAARLVATASDALGEAVPMTALALATAPATLSTAGAVLTGTALSRAAGAANAFSTEMLEGSGNVGNALIAGGTEYLAETMGGKLIDVPASKITNPAVSRAIGTFGEGAEEVMSGAMQAAITGGLEGAAYGIAASAANSKDISPSSVANTATLATVGAVTNAATETASYLVDHALEDFAVGATVGGALGEVVSAANKVNNTVEKVKNVINAPDRMIKKLGDKIMEPFTRADNAIKNFVDSPVTSTANFLSKIDGKISPSAVKADAALKGVGEKIASPAIKLDSQTGGITMSDNAIANASFGNWSGDIQEALLLTPDFFKQVGSIAATKAVSNPNSAPPAPSSPAPSTPENTSGGTPGSTTEGAKSPQPTPNPGGQNTDGENKTGQNTTGMPTGLIRDPNAPNAPNLPFDPNIDSDFFNSTEPVAAPEIDDIDADFFQNFGPDIDAPEFENGFYENFENDMQVNLSPQMIDALQPVGVLNRVTGTDGDTATVRDEKPSAPLAMNLSTDPDTQSAPTSESNAEIETENDVQQETELETELDTANMEQVDQSTAEAQKTAEHVAEKQSEVPSTEPKQQTDTQPQEIPTDPPVEEIPETTTPDKTPQTRPHAAPKVNPSTEPWTGPQSTKEPESAPSTSPQVTPTINPAPNTAPSEPAQAQQHENNPQTNVQAPTNPTQQQNNAPQSETNPTSIAQRIWTPAAAMQQDIASNVQSKERDDKRPGADFNISMGRGSQGQIYETTGYRQTFGGLSSY